MKKIVFLIVFFSVMWIVKGQDTQPGNLLIVIGDSLVGNEIEGEKIREFISNVVITHGNVKITCDRAIQNINRNEVELIGNVIITQDSIEIRTNQGKYYGDSKIAQTDTKVDLTDGHLRLKSSRGYYFHKENRAEFYGEVFLSDSISTMVSDKMIYFNDSDKAFATGRVIANDSANTTLYADTLINDRKNGLLNAYGNVEIIDAEENLTIFGKELFLDSQKKYRKISGYPVFMQIDTTDEGSLDTLFITSLIMEQTADSAEVFFARDSVKILRGNFSSVNNFSMLYRQEGKLITFRNEDEELQPVLWYNYSQLTGDSVYIYIDNNKLDSIDIRVNALIISMIEGLDMRYDQMSGEEIIMNFKSDKLNTVNVIGKVLSIYNYLDEETANGLIKSSSESAVIKFNDSVVENVKLYGSPVSEYHPEELVKGKERDFTIPTFVIREGKPGKELFLKKIPTEKIRREIK